MWAKWKPGKADDHQREQEQHPYGDDLPFATR
jgi:hypothetical protein